MAFAAAAVMDMGLRHIDFEQTYLLADVDNEIYIELPEECWEFPDAVGKLNNVIYGLVQAVRWCMRLTNDLKTLGFEQWDTDSVSHVFCWEDEGDPRGTNGRSSSPDGHERSDGDFRRRTALDVQIKDLCKASY